MSISYEERATEGLEQLGLDVARDHLDAAAQRAAAEGWSFTHFLGYLLDGESAERHRKGVALNPKFAKFPAAKRLEDFDFKALPGLDRRLIEELATERFQYEGRNVVLLGFNTPQASLLFQVICQRYQKEQSVVLTSNKPFGEWAQVFAGD